MANIYKIQSGDTLGGIAKKYNTNVNDLMALNPYITNANLIYAGKNLNLPGANNAPTTSPAPTTNASTPVKTTQQLAEEYANSQTANTGNDTKAMLEQYQKIAEAQKQALLSSKEQTISNIEAGKDDILTNYRDNARQSYINKMLAGKSVEQQLSQAGLNTSGIVGDAYANVENAYGNNLASLQNTRDLNLGEIDKQVNNANLEYTIKEQELLSEVESAKLELQKYGNELAYKRYQDALNNYMNFANTDYTKAQAEQEQANWQKEYELALRQYEDSLKKNSLSSSRGSSGGSSGGSSSSYYISGDNKGNSNKNEPLLTTRAQNWINSMRSIEKERGITAGKEDVTIGIASAIKQNALTENEAKAILRELGY